MPRTLALVLALLCALPAAALDRAAPPVNIGPGSKGDISGLTARPTGDLVSGTLGDMLRAIRLRTGKSQYDFGAVCDGTTDDTAALQAWLNYGQYTKLVMAEGQCIFKNTLTVNYNGVRIQGAGKTKSFLVYAGTSTTIDLITFGDGVNVMEGFDVSDLRVYSLTKMTQGSAMHIKKYRNGQNKLREVSFGPKVNGEINPATQLSEYRLFNGPWFDDVNVFSYTGFDIAASYDGIRVNGTGGTGDPTGSDLFLDDGLIVKATTGIRIGGGFGGFASATVLLIANGTNVSIDTTLANRQNREIFFGRNTVFDQTSQVGLYVNDALAGGSSITIDAFMGSAGYYRPELNGTGINIYVENWKNSNIIVNSSQIFNAKQDSILLKDATTKLSISPATLIYGNGGYAVNSTVATTNVYGRPIMFSNNAGKGLGDKSDLGPLIGNPIDPWKTFTPSVITQNGASLSATQNAMKVKVVAGVCYATYDVTVNSVGASPGGLVMNLPFPAQNTPAIFTGSEIGVTNKALKGSALPGQNLFVFNYDGTTPLQANARIVLSGSYDCQ